MSDRNLPALRNRRASSVYGSFGSGSAAGAPSSRRASRALAPRRWSLRGGGAAGVVAALKASNVWDTCEDEAVAKLLEADALREEALREARSRRASGGGSGGGGGGGCAAGDDADDAAAAAAAAAATAAQAAAAAEQMRLKLESRRDAEQLAAWVSARQSSAVWREEAEARAAVEKAASFFYEKCLVRAGLVRLYQEEDRLVKLVRLLSEKEEQAAMAAMQAQGLKPAAARQALASENAFEPSLGRRSSISFHVYRPPPDWVAGNLLKKTVEATMRKAFAQWGKFRRARLRGRSLLKQANYLLGSTRAAVTARFFRKLRGHVQAAADARQREEERAREEEMRLRSQRLQERLAFINRERELRCEYEVADRQGREAVEVERAGDLRRRVREQELAAQRRAVQRERALRTVRARVGCSEHSLRVVYFRRLHAYFLRKEHHRRATLRCHRNLRQKATEALVARTYKTLLQHSRRRMLEAYKRSAAAELSTKLAQIFLEAHWTTLKAFVKRRRAMRARLRQRAHICTKENERRLARVRFADLRRHAWEAVRRRRREATGRELQARTEEHGRRRTYDTLLRYVALRRVEQEAMLQARMANMLGNACETCLMHTRFECLRRHCRRRRGARMVGAVREAAERRLAKRYFAVLGRSHTVQIARGSNVVLLLARSSRVLLARYYRNWQKPGKAIVAASSAALRQYKAGLLQEASRKRVVIRYFRVLMKHYILSRVEMPPFS